MGFRLTSLGLALLIWVAPLQASAQPTAQEKDTAVGESAVVDELAPVVVHMPGPALWRVSQGQGEVVVLAYFQPLPHSLDWPKGRIVAALRGAKDVLAPPDPKLGAWDAINIALALPSLHNAHGHTLDQVTSPTDYQRFLRFAALAHTDPKHYAHWRPLVAGAALIEDVRRTTGLSSAKPVSTVTHLAKDAKVPVHTVGKVGVGNLLRGVGHISAAQEQGCFHALLDELEWETTTARRAGEAWAGADLVALRSLRPPTGLELCTETVPSLHAVIEQETREAVERIVGALGQPGKTVVLVDLRYLDRRNGLLDQLKARGATISTPQ